MSAAVLGVAAQLASVAATGFRKRAVRGRGTLLLGTVIAARPGRWSRLVAPLRASCGSGPSEAARRWAAPAGAWLAGWILVGGVMGCAVGSVAAYGMWRWRRSRPRTRPGNSHPARAVIARQLPLVADLLAACIAVGAGPREAAEEVGESIGGPVGDRLARTAAEIRLGVEPAEAWGRFGEIPGAGPLARCLHRAGSTGAPAAEPVARLAESMRAERAAAAVARAQRAGVLITAPVGLCFLPAFLAVGVAPVIIGLAGDLLATGRPGR
ncbi:type II secretion protein F [Streptomyces anulatus]|uniref:type II secretion system F family protein n=1 Tax=Streptomyces anulatus TaxID=1892 RepID=UPI0006DA97A4|nr:type II secretion system F family protein [Streptomyces anulatus]KPL33005.1 type II secretion protein F [Streptomyces anulatus]WUC91608.1 type II secretion system F family protein [Streptomyces anulatus]